MSEGFAKAAASIALSAIAVGALTLTFAATPKASDGDDWKRVHSGILRVEIKQDGVICYIKAGSMSCVLKQEPLP